MIEAIEKGLILGLGLSLMTGTTFLALLNIALHRGLKAAISFSFGVFLSDIIIFSVVYFEFAQFYYDNHFRHILSIIGGLLLSIYGFSLLFPPPIQQTFKHPSKIGWSFIGKGIIMNLFNPIVFLFWIGVSTYVSQVTKPISTTIFALFTMLFVDIFKSFAITKFGGNLKPSFLKWLNIISAILLIIIGVRIFFV